MALGSAGDGSGAGERPETRAGASATPSGLRQYHWRREQTVDNVSARRALRDHRAREQLFSAMRYNQEVFAARARTTAQLFFRATNLTLLLSLAAFGWALALYGQSRQLYLALLETEPRYVELGGLMIAAMLFSALAFFLYRDFTKLDALALRSDGRLSDPPESVLVFRSIAAVIVGAAAWAALLFGLLTAMADLVDMQRLIEATALIGAGAAEAAGPADPGLIYGTLSRGVWLCFAVAATGVIWTGALWIARDHRPFKYAVYIAAALTTVMAFGDDLAGWFGALIGRELMLEHVAPRLAMVWTAIGPLATSLVSATALLGLLALCFGVAARWIGLPPLILALVLYVLYRFGGPTLLKAVLICSAAAYVLQLYRPGFVFILRTGAIIAAVAASLVLDSLLPPASRATKLVGERQSIEAAIDDWAAARLRGGDAAAFDGKPYPVFVFAAQGGGMYAAAAAGLFLARVQDRCAHFAQHVFAISGVSGGAVGATFFNAMMNQLPPQGRALTAGARCVDPPEAGGRGFYEGLTADLMAEPFATPVVAGLARDKLFPLNMLFHDAPTGDRARRLERAMAAAASNLGFGASLQAPFDDHWDPARAAPALALNLTRPLDGARVVFAPFDQFGEGVRFRTLEELSARSADGGRTCLTDTRLLEAALASARFPYVLPEFVSRAEFLAPPDAPIEAGADCDSAKARRSIAYAFVDGGYVDASGARTAIEIYAVLAERVRRARLQAARAAEAGRAVAPLDGFIASLRPHVVLLTTDTDVDLDVEALLSAPPQSAESYDDLAGDALQAQQTNLGEISEAAPFDIIAPIQALLNVRKLRAANAIADARNTVGVGAWEYELSGGADPRAFGGASEAPIATRLQLEAAVPRARGYATGAAYALEVVPINVASFHIPLAWRLSETSRDVLSAFVGHAGDCAAGEPRLVDLPAAARDRLDRVDQMLALQIARRVRQNDCAAERLISSLSPNRGPR